MVINDVGLQSEYGVVTEEIDNAYISDGVTAMVIGVRKIQEFLMSRNRFRLKTKYLPQLRINQVISFIAPDTDQTITGRIVRIHVNGDVDNSLTSMDIDVENMSELVGRIYTSGNLLIYPELCGINQINWISSGGVYALSGYFGFEAGSSVSQPLYYIPGETYTLTYEAIKSTGGSFVVSESSSGASSSVGGSGTYTFSFIPLSTTGYLTFSSSGEWFLGGPSLVLILTI
jgi:hypothetical protein